MIRDNCSKIGYITKPHGIDGSVVVRLNGPFADDIEPGEPMFIEIDGTLVPFFVDEIRPLTDMAYIKFGFVDSEKDAGKLRTFSVYTYHEKSDHQPFQLSWAASLQGYRIVDENSGYSAIIDEYIDNPANPLFVVQMNDREVFIPVQEDFVVRINRKKKILYVNLPEGLTDL